MTTQGDDRQTRRRARRFKGGARRQFHGWAETYDRSPLNALLFRPSYLALMEEVAAWRRDRRVEATTPREGGGSRDLPDDAFDLLDVGCGTGSFAAILAQSPWPARITALDYVETMCRSARAKLEERQDAEVVNADSEHLPFPSHSFDLVTCSNSFHHYPHQRAVIDEMFRVLRPGGQLVLIDGFRDNAIGWTVYDVIVSRLEKNVFHAPWSLVRQYMLEAGFRSVRQRKINLLLPALVTTARVGGESAA